MQSIMIYVKSYAWSFSKRHDNEIHITQNVGTSFKELTTNETDEFFIRDNILARVTQDFKLNRAMTGVRKTIIVSNCNLCVRNVQQWITKR